MDALPPIQRHSSAIYNACYMVRHYDRPGQRELRAAAIRALGLACRAAFNETDDFEPVLLALVDGLSARDVRRL